MATILLVDFNLTLSQFRLLWCLKDGKPQTATRLSVALGITKATTTALLQDLTRADLLTIRRNSEDGRSVLVGLSAAGKERLREALEGLAAVERTLSRKLTPGVAKALDQFDLKEDK